MLVWVKAWASCEATEKGLVSVFTWSLPPEETGWLVIGTEMRQMSGQAWSLPADRHPQNYPPTSHLSLGAVLSSLVSKIIYLYSRNIFFWKKNSILNQVLSRMDENQSFNPFIELAMGRAHRVKNVCCLTSIRLNMISKFPFQHLLESLIYFPRRPRWN